MQAYVYCIVGFVSIWLIFDVSDNISVLLDAKTGLSGIAKYYLTQLPQTMVILLPVALLLALLFALGRMSRSNEIVSMLTAGVSVTRVLVPLIVLGLLTALASLALNYSLAPHADVARRVFISGKTGKELTGQIFRNRTDLRTWFIQRFRPGDNVFNTIQVLQQDNTDHITESYLAGRAVFHPDTRDWELQNAKLVHYDNAGNILAEESKPEMVVSHWTETPYRLSSANFRAEQLGIDELRAYLHFNSDFPETLLAPFRTHLYYRWALPWSCLVVVFIAAPLGIGYGRRGVLASVASAIVLVFAMNFMSHLFLALGEGDRIRPWLAAWAPGMVFIVIGAWLLYLRSSNRDVSPFNAGALRRIFAR